MKKYFLDTNILIHNIRNFENEKFAISSVTLSELENIKTSKNKTEDIRYCARKSTKWLAEHPDQYEVVIYNDEHKQMIENSYLDITPDNMIIACCPSDYIFVTNDLCCQNIASKVFQLETLSLKDEVEQIYEGYKVLKGNTDYINENIDKISLLTNEYLLIENTDDNSCKEMRFDGEKLIPLKLPPSKYIKGKNALQRCALDMLNNPEITIIAILGTYGSGKTYMAMQMGLYSIREKPWQSKMLGVREVIGEGKEIGYLPGDTDDKTGAFFSPLIQSLNGGIYELESLKQNGVLETNIPYFMKGTTYNNTVIVCDEAEDLTSSQIKLIGTRLGENSRIFFSGDYKQSLINKTSYNALVEMCNRFKGNPKFACICLDTDVRSETSRMFAELL